MAAPDRAYRYFTNLISKTTDGNSQTKHYIRCAKPLSAYISQSSVTSQEQIAEFCAKFKVDGILWVKNPDVPKQANDDPNTVTIIDPNDPNEEDTLTIIDPDLSDSNRDGIIAYVYPNGQNAKYHDIRTSINGGNSQYTNYRNRSWSRASKFRYKKYGDSEEAIILNDAGLNRRGDCSIQSIGSYNSASDLTAIPRFNDVQVTANFWTTCYNKIENTKLWMAVYSQGAGTQNWQLVSDGGIIFRGGPTISYSSETPSVQIRYIGKELSSGTDPLRTSKITYNSTLLSGISVSHENPSDPSYLSLKVTIPNYMFKIEAVNEEGTIEYIDKSENGRPFGLFRWNSDDYYNFETLANNAITDRISLSHSSPETALERYNNKYPVREHQLDGLYLNQNGDTYDNNATGDSPNNHGVALIYTKTQTFNYSGSPEGSNQGVTVNDVAFFHNEQINAITGITTYTPVLPMNYIIYYEGIQGGIVPSGNQSVYLTMRCNINNTSELNESGEGVYCIKYCIYNGQALPAIDRVWKMAYDETNHVWYWPKSIFNKNVKITPVCEVYSSNPQGIPLTTTMLENNKTYALSLLVNNIDEGETFSIDVVNKTPLVAEIRNIDDTSINIQGGEQAPSRINNIVSTGKTMWVRNLFKVNRISTTPSEKSRIIVTVIYKSYTLMEAELSTTTIEKTLSTYGHSEYVSGFIAVTHKSDYTSALGPQARPQDILSANITVLNQGKEVTYYTNNGKVYTDVNGTTLFDGSGYYLLNYVAGSGGAAGTADKIYYMDGQGNYANVNIYS